MSHRESGKENKTMNPFEAKLKKALIAKIKAWRTDGTTGMSFDCLSHTACLLPYAGGWDGAIGAPMSMRQWRTTLRFVVNSTPTIKRFVTDA